MDTVLIILAVLGIGIVLVAAYVFTVAARNYVSEQSPHGQTSHPAEPEPSAFTDRTEKTRRQQTEVYSFPITSDGMRFDEDRRELPERRGRELPDRRGRG